jgi:hypothetical protein
MDDTQHLFRPLDDVESPDLWDRIEHPGPAGHAAVRSGRKALIAAAFALSITTTLVVILFTAFGHRSRGSIPGAISTPPPGSTPSTTVANVTLPDLVGLSDQNAALTLYRLGLKWAPAYRNVKGGRWRVVSMEPAAGTRVVSGASVRLVIATEITPLPKGAANALDCAPSQREPFGGPRLRLDVGGSGYIVANLTGRPLRHETVVQVTSDGPEWEGLWHVMREGSVIAVVAYPSLDGVACSGSGVAGT